MVLRGSPWDQLWASTSSTGKWGVMGLGGVLLSDTGSCFPGLLRDESHSSIIVPLDRCHCLRSASLAPTLTVTSTLFSPQRPEATVST